MTEKSVETYLDRLEKELSDLPGGRRRELVDEIRAHIDEALALTPDPSEADVRNVLERLGDPTDIAEEARERFGVRRATPTKRDWAAVVLLPFGGLLVLVLGTLGSLGWILGATFLLSSRVWTIRDKVIGLLLFPGGLLLPLILLLGPAQQCVSSTTNGHTTESCTGSTLPPALGIPLLIVLVVTPLVVAAHLASKLRRQLA